MPRYILSFLSVSLLSLISASSARASLIVESGFDLLTTIQPTTFAGVEFGGVDLGMFDFGSEGEHETGNADTIVQRLDDASVAMNGDTDTIDIELVALQLRSANPVDFGLGVDHYFITLDQNNRSLGTMDITFDDPNGGTFSSSIDVDFDIRKGSINGAIAQSGILTLSSSNVEWGRNASPGAVKIKGVNHLLEPGMTNRHDFWVIGSFTETHPSGADHSVTTATPEPATIAIWSCLGLAGLGMRQAKRRRKEKKVA